MEMTYERAAEILDPKHRESYESLAIVEEACQIGADAIKKRIPIRPKPIGRSDWGACPFCGKCAPPPAYLQSHILPLVRPSIEMGGFTR